MTLNELMDELQDLKDSGVSGDIQVRVWADHGQSSMRCGGAYTTYIEEDEYVSETIHKDDLEDYPDAIQVVEIYG